ncbi:MAG: penicillin-binding protein 2 [Patescibacteria group bacterium]
MDRIRIFQVSIYFLAFCILARLFYWQFISSVSSSSDSFSQEIKLPAARGEIYTSDDFPLVANQEAFILYAKPNEISQDPRKVAKTVAPFLISEKYSTSEAKLTEDEQKQKDTETENKENEIAQKISNKKLFWVQLARKVSLLTKKKIDEFNIKGLGFDQDSKRFYPEASMSAHLLGFVGSNEDGDDTGYFGLEGYYNNQLKGKNGRIGQVKDPFGFPILVGKYRPLEPKKGSSLYLSIDRAAQFIVEEKLRQAVDKYGAKEGTVIVADPSSGNIIAMASYPTYNPSIFGEFSEDYFKNPSVADTYEPGSTFKLVTMAAALDLSLVTPNTVCDVCQGPRKIGGYEISTWNNKYYPNSTMTEVIQHSDNIGMTFVSEKLGVDRFYDYIDKFGFGKTTGLDLQEEASGFIRQKDDWKPIDLATASFGQGLAVTPIQMVQAVQAIANNGVAVTPKIVQKIKSQGTQEIVKPGGKHRVISPKTAAQLTEMMVNAVDQGEAKAFVPKGYRIAGKTGTAQIPVAGHYDPNKTIASFIGFAPANKPKFVMLVRFREPSSSVFGSETAAPTFFSIAKDLFGYWGISPEGK